VKLKGSFVAGVLALAVGSALSAGQQAGQTTQSSARQAGGGQTSNGANSSGRGSFQQAQLNRIKDLVGATDDEWKVLEPRVQKVQELQRDSGSRGGGLGGGRGRRGAIPTGTAAGATASPDATSSPVQQATRELQDSLGSKEAKPDDIKSKLTALREARSKAQADLSKAQDQLREVLTARQEAVLVMSGLLN
jgi:Spy/CpxP family protein refolding chaperone